MQRKRIRPKASRHGLTKTSTYRVWANLKARCNNPKDPDYESYGGRGIYHDPRWVKFDEFYKDMGLRPPDTLLDRIDNDGPYHKNNCRWATHSESSLNRRKWT